MATPQQLSMGGADGCSYGQSTTDKISFYGVTPIVQRAASAQGAITDSTGGTATLTLAAITAGASYAQADATAIKNALASLAAAHNELRTVLVNLGLMKGAA
jgi:hypothetical protein